MRLSAWLACAALFAILAPLACAKNGPCSLTSDCDNGYYCANGTCKKDCVDSARDCDPGMYCNPLVGRCQPTLPDGGVPPADGGVDAARMDATIDVPDDTSVGMDVAMQGTKIELDLCGGDGECKPNLICRAYYQGGPARCTRKCNSQNDCWSSSRCLTIGMDTFCAASDVGRACNVMSPTACNYACVTPGYCTVPCASGSDCPNGYGCATVQNKKVCVRAEQYCGNTTCTTLLCDQSGLVDSCTLGCSSAADCPQRALPLAPWTCTSGNCKRPADVYGPLAQGDNAEYACSGSTKVVLCNDALHIDFTQFIVPNAPNFSCPVNMSVAGAMGDQCVDSCRFTPSPSGGCAHGFACVAVGNVANQRVGLCLPSLGAGEVGQSCAHDADCAFGYCSQGKCSRDCTADGLCPTGSTCTAVGGPNVENMPFKRCQ